MKRGLIEEPRQRRWRLLLPVVLLVTTAATTKLAWDAYTWTGATDVARARASTMHGVDQRAAITALLRDCRSSIAVLTEIAKGDDLAAAEQATLALGHINDASRLR